MEPNDGIAAAVAQMLQTKGTWVREYKVAVSPMDYMTADFSVITTPEAINELHQLINKPKMTKLMTQGDAVHAIKAAGMFIGSVDASGNFSVACNPTIQMNGTEARTELKRLAKINPGKLFFVAQLRGAEMVPVAPTLSI